MNTEALNKEIEDLIHDKETIEHKFGEIESRMNSLKNSLKLRYIKFLILFIPFFMLSSLSSLFAAISFLIIIYAILSTGNKKKKLLGADSELAREKEQLLVDFEVIDSKLKETINKRNEIIDSLKFNTYVAGTSFRQKEIKTLVRKLSESYDAYENHDYSLSKKDLIEYGFEDEKVWEYEPIEIDLVLEEEPDNEFDENAIAVYFKNDEMKVHLGYIPKKHINKVREMNIESITGFIKGGKFKLLKFDDYDDFADKEYYELIRDSSDYSVDIIIKQREVSN